MASTSKQQSVMKSCEDGSSSANSNNSCSPHQQQLVDDVCAQFADPSGQIALKKLKIVMRALGLEPRQPEVNEIAKKLSENSAERQMHPDSFSARELEDLLGNRLKDGEEGGKADEIRSVFKLFDTESKGHISISDLRRVAEELEEKLSEDELKEMVNVAESGSKQGKVSEAEFRAIMKKIPLY